MCNKKFYIVLVGAIILCASYFLVDFSRMKEVSKDKFIITELYADDKGNSKFKELVIETSDLKNLGYYSDRTEVQALMFRNSIVAEAFDFHTAPKKQFIVYLSGEAEIETSEGVIKRFKAGDILLANDTSGKGHKSTILKDGQALIIEIGE